MSNEMKLFLPVLISKFLHNSRHSLTIGRTANPDQSCLVVANYKAGKVCLVGDIKDKHGVNKIGAAQIDVGKWQWASKEGFNTAQILHEFPNIVFKQVSPGELHNLLI